MGHLRGQVEHFGGRVTITIPVIAANGAKSTITVADPVVTTGTRGLISAFNPVSDNWQAPNNIVIDGQPFFAENANKAWSLTKVDPYTVRMEVRPGDLWADDGTARSEILIATAIPVGGVFNASWNLTIEPGVINTLAWLSSAQLHDGSPFVSISIANDKMNVLINQTANNSPVGYQDTQPLQRGRSYAMRLQAKKSLGADGFLKIWRDGVLLQDYSGPLGSNGDAPTMKFGVYQGWPDNVSSPIAIRYNHIAIDIPPPPPLPSGLNKIGVTTVGAGVDSGNAGLILAQAVALTTPAQLRSLSFFTGNASGNLKLALYDATGSNGGPGKKLAETAGAVAISGWNTQNVVAPVNLAAGNYWMAYEASSNSLTFRNGGGGQFALASQAYGTMPAPFPAFGSLSSDSWSFYMTVNAP